MSKLWTIIFAMTVLFGYAEKQPFERYQSIINRQPFGKPPPGFDPTVDPATVEKSKNSTEEELLREQQQEKLMKAVGFSVINVENGVTYVGFTDNSGESKDPKAPRKPTHYYLAVGETRNGWFVKEANAVEETMTVVKDDIEVTLKLGDSSKAGPIKDEPPAKQPAGGGTFRPTLRPGTVSTLNLTPYGSSPKSQLVSGRGGFDGIRSRRHQREQNEAAEAAARQQREAERAAKAEAEKAEREARAAEEKAQREAEREERRKEMDSLREEMKRDREERKRLEAEKAALEAEKAAAEAEKKEAEKSESADGETNAQE